MKTKLTALLLSIIVICLHCTACSSPVTADGTWYSVEDATMYNFNDGEITVAGVVVGQYDNDGDVVVISLIDDASNNKLYITQLDGVEVLANVRAGDGKIFFCRGLENAERMIKEAEQREEDMLQDFVDYFSINYVGKWEPIDNSGYKSIVIKSDGTLIFTDQNGEIWEQKMIIDAEGIILATNLRMENRGYESPTFTLYMSDDGTEKNKEKMSVFAIPETYSEDYAALGFYGSSYKRVN